jgi:hypothetical protein
MDILSSRLIQDCAIPEDLACGQALVCSYSLYESKEGYALQHDSRGL